ncbi:uracil-DNA glycosylase [Halodesulfurarchaeum sp. HSR-GB]|uniref:uracil-DNA glycosylase n=1 Tax=Halodesulfurarchaeum sp. HSR-GB TaxID=3074077 RepID=UPI002859D09A|nr:uracil-DNA glycosylase [Halodesulfurarchaeum sp. HSR-GB]MDR5657655.1 uracil-DNA glycosylase [Halodesulfurarchaeum sp. HSR-GB]
MNIDSPATQIEGPDIVSCSGCSELVESRTRIVNGTGPESADVLFVGEAPGANEDEQGEPFVGRSGKILDETLESVGMPRNEVRITNIVRCRPPENRDPHKAEIKNCLPHLDNEIDHIDPNVIVPLGAIPAKTIIADEIDKITEAAGMKYRTEFGRDQTIAIASVHPAATIYNRDLRPKFEKTLEEVANYTD